MLAPYSFKTNLKFNIDSAFYQIDDLKFYYSELISSEELIIENDFINLDFSTEKENNNFTKKSLDVYYQLIFREKNGEHKIYYTDNKPKHLGHRYFYIVKDEKIFMMFYMNMNITNQIKKMMKNTY